jgi:DNA-binding response OmpR family regulator
MVEKILVVEDDPTLQETLAYNLERHGNEAILQRMAIQQLNRI